MYSQYFFLICLFIIEVTLILADIFSCIIREYSEELLLIVLS